MIRKAIFYPYLLLAVGYSHIGIAEQVFHLSVLPRGKSVTLPTPATTLVKTYNQVILTATGIPQTVKLTTSGAKSGHSSALKVSIYDKDNRSFKEIKIVPSSSALYTFKDLDSVRLVPVPLRNNRSPNIKLKIESDKPLEISR